jgi:hypothetical protein
MSKQLTIANLTNPQEATFVAAIFELGGPQHSAEAALRAGYADNLEGAARAAAFLLSAPRISRVIVGEIKARFDVAAAAAFHTLLEVCSDKKAPASARIAAAESILNRSSIGPVPSRSMAITARVGVEDLLERLDAQERGTAHPDIIDGSPVGQEPDTRECEPRGHHYIDRHAYAAASIASTEVLESAQGGSAGGDE